MDEYEITEKDIKITMTSSQEKADNESHDELGTPSAFLSFEAWWINENILYLEKK